MATQAAAGIVMPQATTMLRMTPHRTADARRAAPTPDNGARNLCVVETGMPSQVAGWYQDCHQ